MHKFSRVQLPDLQVVDARLDYSIPVLKVTQELCRELAYSTSRRTVDQKRHTGGRLRKGAHIESENQTQPFN